MAAAAGGDRADIATHFRGWTVTEEDAYAATAGLPAWLKDVELRFYRMRREPRAGTEEATAGQPLPLTGRP